MDHNDIAGFKPTLLRHLLEALPLRPPEITAGCVYTHKGKGLETLSLHDCNLNDENMKPLFNACFLKKTLKKLNLSKNNITDFGLKIIADMMKLRGSGQLKDLDLGCNKLTDTGCVPLA